MTSRAQSTTVLVSAMLAALLTASPAGADRLHLDSGGFIDVRSWWFEGQWVMYESTGGTVGIPRSIVVRVEKAPSDTPAGPFPPSTSAGSVSRRGSGRAEELAEWVEEAVAAFLAGDYEMASSRSYQALQIDPDLHPLRTYYTVSEMQLGRDGSALSAILDGLARDPQRADFHELLGDLRDREERVEDALDSWRRAFRLAPNDRLRTKIFKAERDLEASWGFDLFRTSHFTVRYDGAVDKELAGAVMDHLEEQYRELGGLYSHSPGQPITVLLYANRQFRDVTQTADWVGGLYDGKIRVPLGGLSHLTSRAERLLIHELTHAVVHSKSRGRCPRWLQEGLAQWSEGKRLTPAERAWVVEQLRGKDAAEWEADGLSYAMSLSLTSYLESRRGFGGVASLLALLGDGIETDEAFRQTYGEGYAAVCRGWARSLDE